MTPITVMLVLVLIAVAAYWFGVRHALGMKAADGRRNHSLPRYYGLYLACSMLIPSLLWFFLSSALQNSIINWFLVNAIPVAHLPAEGAPRELLLSEIRRAGNATQSVEPYIANLYSYWLLLKQQASLLINSLSFALFIVGGLIAFRKINPTFRARNKVEGWLIVVLVACASIAILTTMGIIFSVLFEALRFFDHIPIQQFLFGTHWAPASESYGAIPLFIGTLLISAIALVVAVPLGLLSAIYLADYATPKVQAVAKPLLEILAGVPTVVYGFFAAITVAPFIRRLGESMGLAVSSESALAAGVVMGVMIIPFVSSLSNDVIMAVPQSLRDGSYGLGATRSETVRKVVFPAALPGIVGSILLAASRAIGETMIVVMAAGLVANLSVNPLTAVTTVTVQIVTLLVGDQEFDSAKTLAAFALGLLLFLTTLLMNFVALRIVRKYREQYV